MPETLVTWVPFSGGLGKTVYSRGQLQRTLWTSLCIRAEEKEGTNTLQSHLTASWARSLDDLRKPKASEPNVSSSASPKKYMKPASDFQAYTEAQSSETSTAIPPSRADRYRFQPGRMDKQVTARPKHAL